MESALVRVVIYMVLAGGALYGVKHEVAVHDARVFALGVADEKGRRDLADQAKDKAQQEALNRAAEQAALDREKDQKSNQTILKDRENEITDLKAENKRERQRANADSLRLTRTDVCGQLPSPRAAPGSVPPDAAGADTVELPLKIETSLRDLASDADETIGLKDAKIRALQQWLIDHGFYKQ